MTTEEIQFARDTLDTMLGYLGFVTRVEIDDAPEGQTLQVLTEESELLIGNNGERLEDIQYLLNRLVQVRDSRHPRVRVDIEHYRTMHEDAMLERVKELAERVRRSGKAIRLRPMNSYHRRLVHNLFADDPGIESSSPNDRARMKRITLRKTGKKGGDRESGDSV